MKDALRVITVIGAIILSVMFAVCAGAFLAMYDTGNTVTTAYAKVFDNNAEEIIVEPQKIIQIDENIVDEMKKSESKNNPESDEKPEIDIQEVILKKKSQEQNEETDDTEDADSAEETEEREPAVITAEIAGIKQVVKAGTNEVVAVNTGEVAANTGSSSSKVLDPMEGYPRPYEEVDMSYFEDALFIGDSRMQGLGMYSNIPATFYAATAFQLFNFRTANIVQTPNGKVPILTAIPFDAFTKIYIKVGLNELGCASETKFIEDYQELITGLRMMEPRAIIYVHAVLPVTAAKSATDKFHNNPNIIKRNELLKNFADANKCYFVDVKDAVADETGALIKGSAPDGIHMYGKYMGPWVEYLRTHAVKVTY